MAFPKLPVRAAARPEISRDPRRSRVARFTKRYIGIAPVLELPVTSRTRTGYSPPGHRGR
jgi:hypothetical protein